MKYVRPAIFGSFVVLLPGLLESLDAGKPFANGLGVLAASTVYLIPSVFANQPNTGDNAV